MVDTQRQFALASNASVAVQCEQWWLSPFFSICCSGPHVIISELFTITLLKDRMIDMAVEVVFDCVEAMSWFAKKASAVGEIRV